MMTVFMAVREVELQRSPYAGSANRFRGLPVYIVPVMSSLPSINNSPSTATQVRSIDLTTILTSTTPTIQQPEKSATVRGIVIPGRISSEFISNRNQNQYRDYDDHHHHHHHNHQPDYRRERDFDYNVYD